MKISDIIMCNINQDYLLPSIQREFVWLANPKERRIEKLFDSILQGYPIGNILVWSIEKELSHDSLQFEVYKLIQNYDKNNPHNDIASLNGYRKIYLILDGQQRLTALNLGLRGVLFDTSKKRIKESRLYLNLIYNGENELENEYGFKYEFRFLDKAINNENELWYEVGKVLDYRNGNAEHFKTDHKDYILKNVAAPERILQANEVLGSLFYAICGDKEGLKIEFISPDDEKALNIFVRLNDGGVKLEKADMLLSYMESDKNIFTPNGARKEITGFVDTLNTEELHKPNYNISKDDLLKACLVMSDLEVQYRLKNFNSDNLKRISDNWEEIKKYYAMTIDLIARYNFSNKNVVSSNSLIPIAYYLMLQGKNLSFVFSQNNNDLEIKNEIIKWLVISQITGAFGSSSDSTLKKIREALKSGKAFRDINLDKVIQKETVEKWINRETYGSKYSHLLLLLTTSTAYWDDCHQDHIFPESKFKKSEYEKYGLSEKQIKYYEEYKNSILNMQLLNPFVNISKTNDNFIDWSNSQNKIFLESATIPTNKEYCFTMFNEFVEVRRTMMVDKIYEILKI